ncbi:MFS transporter [Acidianus sulfidivorans JP7]|uniref:MFS transporter n=1 Tax=Acidianus sulfidivorans JP7 TaxID=619593 RepID=A0A2U9IK59_9CREN|nr:MFS transporter [Acidianus sulfidivorans]AWR96427.1 MFS transporter [Acidianus sulfidivorans JP7]
MARLEWKNVVVSGMGVFTDGYNLYSISLAYYFISSSFHFSNLSLGLIIASSYYGAAITALLFGVLADKIGRKTMYGIDASMMSIGALLQAFSQNIPELFISRLILGAGIGADYVLSPIIVAENSNAKSRGKLMVITFAVMWGLGAVAAAFVEQLTILLHLNPSLIWRIVLGVGAIPAFSVIYLRRKVFETILYVTRVKPKEEEIKGIEKELGKKLSINRDTSSFSHRLKSSAFLIIIASILWLLYDIYSSTFSVYGPIAVAGNLGISPIEFTYIAQFAAGIPGQIICISLIDKVGRKPLIVLGYAGVALWLFMYFLLLSSPSIFGLHFSIPKNPIDASKALTGTAAMLGFLFYLLNYLFSAIGPASIIGSAMVTPELVPTKVRGTGQAISVSIDRLSAALASTAFPLLLSDYGFPLMVGIYSAIALISSLITLFLIPETKGKELEYVVLKSSSKNG